MSKGHSDDAYMVGVLAAATIPDQHDASKLKYFKC